jgi:hypothetical protein
MTSAGRTERTIPFDFDLEAEAERQPTQLLERCGKRLYSEDKAARCVSSHQNGVLGPLS